MATGPLLEPDIGVSGNGGGLQAGVEVKKQENRGNLGTSREALMASRAGPRDFCDSESQKSPRFSCFFTLLQLTALPRFQTPLCPVPEATRIRAEKLPLCGEHGGSSGLWRAAWDCAGDFSAMRRRCDPLASQ